MKNSNIIALLAFILLTLLPAYILWMGEVTLLHLGAGAFWMLIGMGATAVRDAGRE